MADISRAFGLIWLPLADVGINRSPAFARWLETCAIRSGYRGVVFERPSIED